MNDTTGTAIAEKILDCAFCRIVDGTATTQPFLRWDDAIAITPLDPVTPGHMLVIPNTHVQDAAEDPGVTAAAMRRAAELAAGRGDMNLITSIGTSATQTVRHLHIHLVPRSEGDGLMLPWTVPVGAAIEAAEAQRHAELEASCRLAADRRNRDRDRAIAHAICALAPVAGAYDLPGLITRGGNTAGYGEGIITLATQLADHIKNG